MLILNKIKRTLLKKQFLENDRKVLNFDISWFDDKYDKEEKVYKMNYYLADGKVSNFLLIL